MPPARAGNAPSSFCRSGCRPPAQRAGPGCRAPHRMLSALDRFASIRCRFRSYCHNGCVGSAAIGGHRCLSSLRRVTALAAASIIACTYESRANLCDDNLPRLLMAAVKSSLARAPDVSWVRTPKSWLKSQPGTPNTVTKPVLAFVSDSTRVELPLLVLGFAGTRQYSPVAGGCDARPAG